MKKLCLLVICIALVAVNHSSSVRSAARFGSLAEPVMSPVIEPVIWTNIVNCAADGSSLRKVAGANDTPDAGASSQQQITSGDGYVEFTVVDKNRELCLGLTNDFAGTAASTIDFSIYLSAVSHRGGALGRVIENGVNKGDTVTYKAGSIFRIAVEGEAVKYYHDGALFYTSAVAPTYPLVADAALIDVSASVSQATINGSFVEPPPDTQPPAIGAIGSSGITATGATIVWTTDEPATSNVDYGLTSDYGSTATSSTLKTAHSLTLSGLQPDTLYHYRARSADAAGNQSETTDLFFTTATSGGSGEMAGKLDDNGIYRPANYTSFPDPAVGLPYPDSVFGSMITRLSNGLLQFNDGVHHEYSSMSPFNADNTRILVATHFKGFYLVDRSGVMIGDFLGLGHTTEPRWSTTDPEILYYHAGNQIIRYNVATRQKSVERTFSQFKSITFGGGESDISEDGDHIIIVGDGRQVGLYQFSTGVLGTTLSLKGLKFDNFDVTANNNVIVRWASEGTGRNRGIELFDRNMNFIRQVTPFGAHADRGRDLDGNEVLVVAAYRDTNPPPGCENNGVEVVRLDTAQRTCLIGLDWNSEIHISANSSGSNPWVIISVTDTQTGTANSPLTLPGNWESLWQVRYNEVILVKIDGSEKRRMAHHRSRVMDSYWFMPRATISRDGKYAIYDSNLGSGVLSEYTDVFLIDLTKN